jgi:hypothetical protein
MTEQTHPSTKALVVIGIIVAFWLLVTLVILGVFGIKEGWPAFLTLPLFFLIGGTDKKQLVNIFAGGAVGILLAAVIPLAVKFLVTSAGLDQTLGILIVVGLLVFIIIALGGSIPMLFSNFTFVYFTAALIPAKQATIAWLGTLVLGGGFFLGTCLLSMALILPKLTQE